MRQFFLRREADQLVQCGDVVALDREESHHLFTVLRGGRHNEIFLTDGRGNRYKAVSKGKDGKIALVEIVTSEFMQDEVQAPQLVLYCGLVKGKRFEFVLEKAVELGVHRIVPLLTEHGVVDPRNKKQDRWHTILKTALKQSLRCTLPQLDGALDLSAAVIETASCKEAQLFFGAVPGELPAGFHISRWPDIMSRAQLKSTPQLALFVGPEGGWSPDEQALLLDNACQPVDLGPHVLRTETAALAGLSLLQAVRQCYLTNQSPEENVS